MSDVDQAELDERFRRYYDAEAVAGVRSDLGPLRRDLRQRFERVLADEGRTSLIDVGGGPGRDVEEFAEAGFSAVGLDIATENIRTLRANGHVGLVGSVHELPIRTDAFDAVWTMSTLVHVPDERLRSALTELTRIAAPGAPIGIGSWGGRDWEGTSDFTRFDPPRFFSLRDHDRWRATLESVGAIEMFETFETANEGWEYQFAIVRS